jgi:KamA family protein
MVSYRPISSRQVEDLEQIRRLSSDYRRVLRALNAVFPFRVNRYVVDELIDWSQVPDDPIYQLTFPQPSMLSAQDLARVLSLIDSEGHRSEKLQALVREILLAMNPHPAGQMEMNVPTLDGKPLQGIQHKYRESVLFFPSQGQTCHAYCTYCFRWPQFAGLDDFKFSSHESEELAEYVRRHPEVSDVLFTGGDPMVMKTAKLRTYFEALTGPGMDHVRHFRIGTKALAYWPQRFTDGKEADDLLRFFEDVHRAGRQVAIMAHCSHARELESKVAREAVRRLRDAGCVIRSQAPLIRNVNDSPQAWTDLWRGQLRLGIVPYYMFVSRDTGPRNHFAVTLEKSLKIYREAIMTMSGLGRTARGPSMSATPGKVCLDGITEIHGEKVFALRFLQGRDPDWIQRPFFAKFDSEATWLDDLKPAFGEEKFFFE